MRLLIKAEVFHDGASSWTLRFEDGRYHVFRGTREEFALFLRRIEAADDKESPRSYRSMTFKAIVDEIIDGTDNKIWVFSNFVNELFAK